MKKKLTITLDADVIPIAERYAQSRGVSLSSLIEQALKELTAEGEPSFSSRWRGKFQAARRNDARYEGLARKYL